MIKRLVVITHDPAQRSVRDNSMLRSEKLLDFETNFQTIRSSMKKKKNVALHYSNSKFFSPHARLIRLIFVSDVIYGRLKKEKKKEHQLVLGEPKERGTAVARVHGQVTPGFGQ